MFKMRDMNGGTFKTHQHNHKWFSYIDCTHDATRTRTKIKTNPWVVSNAKIIIPNVSKIIIYDKHLNGPTIQGDIAMKTLPEWSTRAPGEFQWNGNQFNPYIERSSDILSEYARISNSHQEWNCLQEKYLTSGHNSSLIPRWTLKENMYWFNMMKLKLIREFQSQAFPNADIQPFLKLRVQPRNNFTKALWNIQQRLSSNFRQFVKENKVINDRVNQLKEEEMIKFQERKKYQSQTTQSKKKALLLQTLRNLRCKLDDQRHRLQKSYTRVMDLQSHNIANQH